MTRLEPVILRGERRLFLSILLTIILSAFAATNVFAAPFAYISNRYSDNLSVIDTATNTVVATVAVESGPFGVAVNPAGTRVYVANQFSNTVSVIDTATNTVVATVAVGSGPTGVAVNPAGTRVYVANHWSNSISVINTATNTVVATAAAGFEPVGVAFNPAGTRVYVANHYRGTSGTVSVINTATNTVVATVGVGIGPLAYGQFIRPSLVPQCVEPPAGLVSWWPGEGNADDIVNGNDGTLQNGVAFAPGVVGQAFSFDGVNDEVNVPYAANLNPTQALTLDAWVNVTSLTNAANGGYQGVVSMSEGQRAYFFGITGTGSNHMGMAGNVHLEGFGIGSAHRTSAAVITPGQWYHIASVIEPNTGRFEIYVNGVLQPAVSSGGGPQLASVSNVPFRIGFSDPGFPYHFNGLIDEVELFNHALSAQEIQAIFNAGSAGKCKPPADATAPTTTASISGTLGSNGWYVSNVQVTLTAVDNEGGTGVKKTEYSFDGTTWSTYTSPFEVTNEGTTTVYYRSIDNADNVESTNTKEVKIDKTVPSIMGSRTPGPNANGWNNTDVTVSFTCSDGLSDIDSCGPTPQVVSSEGAGQSRTGTAVDKAGKTASTTVSGINIDKTPPTVTYSGNAGTYTVDQMVSITCTAADVLSGVASTTCANINGPAYAFTLGTNNFSASATDLAGNTGSGSTSFTVVVTYESLRSLTRQFVGQRGILNSLEAKMNAAAAAEARGNAQAKAGAIGAFINEVQAQAGKALAAAQAATLITLAQAL